MTHAGSDSLSPSSSSLAGGHARSRDGRIVTTVALPRTTFVATMALLETTDAGAGELARTVGYGSVETLHRVFRQRVGITPSEYRRRFGAPNRPTASSARRHPGRATPPSIA